MTFPSGDMQQRLVRSLYQEANISPEQVEYVEAHGTGTKVSQSEKIHKKQGCTCCELDDEEEHFTFTGRGSSRSEWHCQCILSVTEGSPADWLHQIQHGTPRARLWIGGTCQGTFNHVFKTITCSYICKPKSLNCIPKRWCCHSNMASGLPTSISMMQTLTFPL